MHAHTPAVARSRCRRLRACSPRTRPHPRSPFMPVRSRVSWQMETKTSRATTRNAIRGRPNPAIVCTPHLSHLSSCSTLLLSYAPPSWARLLQVMRATGAMSNCQFCQFSNCQTTCARAVLLRPQLHPPFPPASRYALEVPDIRTTAHLPPSLHSAPSMLLNTRITHLTHINGQTSSSSICIPRRVIPNVARAKNSWNVSGLQAWTRRTTSQCQAGSW
jgi:hypothetical protein